MKIDRKVGLRVEELESRVVPSTVSPPATPPAPYAGWASTNWSGIDLDTKNGAATAVSASWAVPAVTVPATGPVPVGYSSTWVGIDGDLSSTVEQIGTESDTTNTPLLPKGTPQYFAWYEMYPSGMNIITTQNGAANPNADSPFIVSPGDAISAAVNYLNTTTTTTTITMGRRTVTTTTTYENFLLTITDSPANGGATEYYSTNQQISGAQLSSAEWIEEAPSSSSVLPLANFGSVTLTGAQATISGASGSIASFVGNSSVVNYGTTKSPLEINLMDMGTFNRTGQWTSVEDETSLLSDTPSNPTAGGDSFTVQFGSKTTYTNPTTGTTIPLYGPMDRVSGLADVQVTVADAGAPAGPNPIVVAASPAPPVAASNPNPEVVRIAVVQPGFFRPAEANLGRADVVIAGVTAGEANAGAGFSWFGLPAVFTGVVVQPAAGPVHGSAMTGGVRFVSSAELFDTACSPFDKPALAPPSTLAFSEDIPIDRLLGALVLVAFLPSQLARAKEEPKRARQWRDGDGRPN